MHRTNNSIPQGSYAPFAVMVGIVAICCHRPDTDGGIVARHEAKSISWVVKQFTQSKVCVELPVSMCVERDSEFGVVLGLDPIPDSLLLLDDTVCALTISITRMREEVFLKRRDEHLRFLPQDQGLSEAVVFDATRHSVLTRRVFDGYAVYRFDRPCVGGYMIRTSAQFRARRSHDASGGDSLSQDDATVQRILRSARCL